MTPTLCILAAGMGSRYGGLKQLDGVGPDGETIMDYSVFDAARAGFGRVVFVIRRDFEADFRARVLSRYADHIPTEVVFQSMDDLPDGFTCPPGRTKPWGTNHAVWMARHAIREPFAVINADDFYGRDSFATLARALSDTAGREGDYCMVGFRVGNTLSPSGTVSRGICTTDAKGYLTGIVERTAIARVDGQVRFTDEHGTPQVLADDTPVSMNMWGFTPDYFAHTETYFRRFLAEHATDERAEYYIPWAVNELITSGTARVRVLDTTSSWFGVTYAEDRAEVVRRLRALTDAGEYPATGLFQSIR